MVSAHCIAPSSAEEDGSPTSIATAVDLCFYSISLPNKLICQDIASRHMITLKTRTLITVSMYIGGIV